MDAFTLIVIVGLVAAIGTLLAVGLWHPGKAMEITDKDRQERWATQAEVEETEVDEMVEGQNVYRRARGETEITAADAQRAGSARQRASIERAKRQAEQDES